ncbi:EAL domain-containing protein [Rhodopseudomonas sp. HC1]|uniref:putative bifunctional diguanylate cyclase/phosphodiesterase n=1 Tax=Rhodopseudomonas infernalis TaxID=2897386 RepID=UPI001EE8F68A|nr:GGDEF domain-containing phosphodiesterase [Rhodopseudomonas infernalis]MCG6204365.1 EAL domain-containing protein [Rhodopseudomonas infernalis]
MPDLWLYDQMSRLGALSYRLKIMLVAFLGIHVPLVVVVLYIAALNAEHWGEFVDTLVVTLLATLLGSGLTLFVLSKLLSPVLLTAQALEGFRCDRNLGKLPRHYTDEAGRLMACAAETIDHLETTLDRLEHVDEATGLPNRRQLLASTAQAIEQGSGVALAVVRFADHARVTNAYGNSAAERAMAILARRLGSFVAEGKMLARPGRAELAILGTTDTNADSQAALGFRIRDVVKSSSGEFALGGIVLDPFLQSGLAFHPADGASAENLLDAAAAAATQSGPAMPLVLHSAAATRAARSRFELEHDLRRALPDGQLDLNYQPIVDLDSHSVVGAEALLRWHHPERGMVSPAEFIPLAEATDLIRPIGLWMLSRACTQIREWARSELGDIRLAVNLSARQFLDKDLVPHVRGAIEAAGISPDRLEIELTETAAMADHAHTRRVFTALRDLGVGIALDDFGTGYASMSYLRKLPFNKLKIDREFVHHVDSSGESQAICDALIALSRGLGINVLAEGAEREEEVRHLLTRGCSTFQGYYFARPVPANDLGRAVGLAQLRMQHHRMEHADRGPADLGRQGKRA